MKKALVIIPTYNEVENVKLVLEKTFSLKRFDVLIVDDSSPDGTAAAVNQLMPKYPKKLFLEVRNLKEGLGKAYIHGFKWALKNNYEYIFEMDADLSHDPNALIPMLELLESDVDFIVGSRYVDGINVVNWPLSRILLSYFASIYVRLITFMPIKDPTAGYVGYRRNVLEELNLDEIQFVGYAFQIEMKYKAWRKRFSFKEYPIVFADRKKGISKMNGNIIWEALYGVLDLRIKDFFKKQNGNSTD